MENNNSEIYKLCYDEYLSEFCTLPLQEKQKKIIEELKALIALTNKLCIDYHISSELLISKEMADTERENYSQDDFAESVFAYLETFKESYGSFLKRYAEDNYVSEDDNFSTNE